MTDYPNHSLQVCVPLTDSKKFIRLHSLVTLARVCLLRLAHWVDFVVAAVLGIVFAVVADFLQPASRIPAAIRRFRNCLEALDSKNWSLFDFRELRDWADHARSLDPRLTKLIFGFDLAVVIPEGCVLPKPSRDLKSVTCDSEAVRSLGMMLRVL